VDTETSIPTEITLPTSTQPALMETVTFTTEDGVQLAGSLFGEGKSAVILAHQGTQGADQTGWQTFGKLLGERGFAALAFDFRGIGQSGGSLNYSALDQDVAAALQFLRDRGYEKIACVGASMGGTACIRVALDDELAGLAALGSTMLAGGGNGLRITQDEIALLALPKLFITAAEDSFSVVDHTTRMYELSSDPKELHLLPGKEHGTDLFNTDAGEELTTILLDFLENLPDTSSTSIPPTIPIMGDTWVRPNDEATMLYVPSGTFQMGSTDAEIEDAIDLCQKHYNICNRWYYERESPQHAVSLDGYWMDQTEITNAQYRQCVQAGTCTEPSICKKGQATYADADKTDHPVVCVNWEEAQTYCEWTGARLPTEAEWEFSFRGEVGSIYPWGDEFDGSMLNYCDTNCSESHADDRFDDRYPQTAPVGSFPQGKSWSGALDMGGNVTEWMADWLGDYSSAAVSNPGGPTTGREKMLKGCSWFFHPTYCRGAARASVDPDTRLDYVGFRCVVSINQNAD
jgi:formylglycine-generating enzyme required for sulfatase activity